MQRHNCTGAYCLQTKEEIKNAKKKVPSNATILQGVQPVAPQSQSNDNAESVA